MHKSATIRSFKYLEENRVNVFILELLKELVYQTLYILIDIFELTL